MFGWALFAPRGWRAAGVVALLVLVGPKIAALFPLWLAGAAAYWLCSRRRLPEWLGWLLAAGGLALWAAYEVYVWRHGRPSETIYPESLIQPYVVGLLFTAHLIGLRFIAWRIEPVLRAVERPIRWIAGATLTLYLFHLPIAQFLAAVMPWPPASWPARVLMFAGVPALVFAIAEVTERRKQPWRRGFLAAAGWIAAHRRAA